eukprot:CAMPEP_0197042506 /NCGR_PEP_ID=MMETSP1384-20130603/18856_1 /TAXON_ID=29189 /ORGANISM="Ammonia sp." /LENGTH=323 /DNA_ID=CAMNT_0042473617 /DNA_START=50 /DNA_END=1018 /DNA_ORIENTATION=-
MKAALLTAALFSFAHSQDSCVYTANDGQYTLNLTQVSRWTLEYETTGHFYYYTPCRNGIQCQQGNAVFYANSAQYQPGANQCEHYLSVDHREQAQYSFIGGSWRFSYEDGEFCDTTQSPRTTTVYYHCNDVNNQIPALLETAGEGSTCNYFYSIASTLACVPQNSHNANCQWRTPNGNGGWNYLDLSALKGTVVHAPLGYNGYELYHSICSNSLTCYQQHQLQVMSVIDNRETNTCDHSLGVWEQGQVQPLLHDEDEDNVHWTFHYWNGQTCSTGAPGEEKVRFFCDPSVDTYKVLGAYGEGNCMFDLNISTKAACLSQEQNW